MTELLQIGIPRSAPLVKTARKQIVYTAEFNVVLGAYRYLPYSTGLLRAYVQTDPTIKNNIEFQPFLYELEPLSNVMGKFEKAPDVVAFSVSMWNEQLNLATAKEVKRRWPNCLILFGGCHVPHHPTDYMRQYDFIDACVRSEGEETFKEVLQRHLEHASFSDVLDLTYRTKDGDIIENLGHRNYQKDMDVYPSPYLEGHFDYLMKQQTKEYKFQCIIETNRGCPFDCSFCVSGDTQITTDKGVKRIRDVQAGDSVLGWNDNTNKEVWNLVEHCVPMGRKPVLHITAGDFSVEVTADHRIYTKRGWKQAGELYIGDEILSHLWSGNKEQEEEILFSDMLEQIDGTEADVEQSTQRREVCKCSSSCVQIYDREQPNEEGRDCEESWTDSEGTSCERGDSPIYVHGGGEEDYWRYSQEESARPRQSNEESSNLPEDIGYEEESSQYLRSESNGFSGLVGTAVSVHRGLVVLDRAVQVGEVQESRLRPYSRREIGDFGSRKILASETRDSGGRVEGLRESGMEVSNRVERYETGRAGSFEDKRVRWVRITKIIPGKVTEVYDLANLTPFPNFFANGILVHNCYWAAGGLMTKYRFHSLDYVKNEVTWVGKNRIIYAFGADSNFGMHRRDFEIAEHMVAVKKQYGRPIRFRVCYGKNTDDKIFQVATILHDAQLEKGITLARQSNDETTLQNIHRANISLDTYRGLQKRFNDKGIPTYIELILGLPGETLDSWRKGIDECLIGADEKTSLFCYICQCLPNTDMCKPEYRAKHGIKTRFAKLTEIHGSERDQGLVQEYEELVVATGSMPHRQWRKAAKFSWMAMMLHTMKVAIYPLAWLWDRFQIPPSALVDKCIGNTTGVLGRLDEEWEGILDRVAVFGEGRGTIVPGCDDTYFDVEEAGVITCVESMEDFYEQLKWRIGSILEECNASSKGATRQELEEVLRYQQVRLPHYNDTGVEETHEFTYNVPEYFAKLFSSTPVPLEKKRQTLTLKQRPWNGDKAKFGRELIFWGRKSGDMLEACEWKDVEELCTSS